MANEISPIAPHRRRVNAFVDRHQLAWDLAMAGLALAFIALAFVEDQVSLTFYETWLSPLEIAITAVFVAEFALRFYAAESRAVYLRHHWIDLIALLPAVRALRFLRLGRLTTLLRLARVLRIGALVRLLSEVERAGHRISFIAKHNGVHVFLALAAGIVAIGGTLVYLIENGTNPEFKQYPNAIWWAFATMATVGYGEGPTTALGRILAGLIMIVGIGCFGLLTATVTTLFIEHTHGPQPSANELKALLQDIAARLERVERELEEARGKPPTAPTAQSLAPVAAEPRAPRAEP